MPLPAWLGAGIVSGISSMFQNRSNEDIARWNTDLQLQTNQQNIEHANYWNQRTMQDAWDMAVFNQNYADRVNEQNRADTAHYDALNYQRQLEAAQNSILWRVQDAQRAGLHPLAALGAAGSTIMPSQLVGGGVAVSSAPGGAPHGSNSIAPQRGGRESVLGKMGQDISRAIMASQSREEREEAQKLRMYDQTMRHLGVEKAQLENDYLRSQIARTNRDQVGSPAATLTNPGMRPSNRVEVTPNVVVASGKSASAEAGQVTDMGYVRTPHGMLKPLRSYDYKQRSDEDIMGNIDWNVRNRIMPFINQNWLPAPSLRDYPLPKGQVWKYSRWDGAFRPVWSATNKWVKRSTH